MDYIKDSKTIVLDNQEQPTITPAQPTDNSNNAKTNKEFISEDIKITVTDVKYQDTMGTFAKNDDEMFAVVYFDIINSLEPNWNVVDFAYGFKVNNKIIKKFATENNTPKIKPNSTTSAVVFINIPSDKKITSVFFVNPITFEKIEIPLG